MNVCLCVQDCVHGAKCVTFVCPLINMNKSATLTVRARLWNATMIEVQTVMLLGSRLRFSAWLSLSADGGWWSHWEELAMVCSNWLEQHLSDKKHKWWYWNGNEKLCLLLWMFQDYSNARSVLIRGRATLKLQSNKSTITKESHSAEVIACV